MAELGRSPLTGFAGPTALVAVITGVGASLAVFIIAIALGDALTFAAYTPIELVKALALLAAIGLIVGLVAIWPTCLIMSFVGLKLAATRPWAATKRAWIGMGAATGAILILLPYLSSISDGLQLAWIALFGAGCGAFAGWLCHRWIGIGAPPPQ